MSAKYKVTAKGRIAPNGYRLCDPLKVGDRVVSTDKTEWIVGKPIGVGGFGEVYTCHNKNDPTQEYVMKIDNTEGPLFVEIHFMTRACKDICIDSYIRKRQIDFLGIPKMIAFGRDISKKIRFLVVERLGEELETILNRTRLPIETVCRITCRIIDALEYMHENGYIHADIKAANILRTLINKSSPMRGAKRQSMDQNDLKDDRYYLIDFGLAEKLMVNNVHRAYEEDERRANNGTRQFRSRDAHIGVVSRRSDMESLGWNLLVWLYGRHPWEPLLKCDDAVYEKKCWAMKNISQCLEEAFSDSPLPEFKIENKSSKRGRKAAGEKIVFEIPERTYKVNTTIPKGLDKYFYAVEAMQYDERPNYVALKEIVMAIAKLNTPKSDSHRNDNGSPIKKLKLNSEKITKTRAGLKAARNDAEKIAQVEPEMNPPTTNNKRRRKGAIRSSTSIIVSPVASKSVTKNSRTKIGIKTISKDEGPNEDESIEFIHHEPIKMKKINGQDPHEAKSLAVNERPKRGAAAAAAALNQASNSTLNTASNGPDKFDKHSSKNLPNDKNEEELLNHDDDDDYIGGIRHSKRPRTSTYLHEVSLAGRIVRRSLVRHDTDSDDDNDTNRRIYIGNNLSASKRKSSNQITAITNKKNSPTKFRMNSASSGEDSKNTIKSNDEIDDDDATDNDDGEDEDEIPFSFQPKVEEKKPYPLAAKNGHGISVTKPNGKSFETPHMIKLRQKLNMKKAAAKAILPSSENGHTGRVNTKASNGTRTG